MPTPINNGISPKSMNISPKDKNTSRFGKDTVFHPTTKRPMTPQLGRVQGTVSYTSEGTAERAEEYVRFRMENKGKKK